MTHESVDAMLKDYKFSLGRVGHLGTEIERLRREIDRERAGLAEDVAAINAQQITDMPRGTTVGNPTERSGLKLASGWTPEHIREMEQELAAMDAEWSKRRLTVMFVEAWLNGLGERERWIIEQQIIDEVFWRDIIIHYRATYHEEASKDTLKRLRNKALEKIYKMAE